MLSRRTGGKLRTQERHHRSQVVGRTAEFAQLEQHLTQALAGQRQLVFVTGEPGIGKTTVVDTFLVSLAALPDVWIGHGQCVEQYGAGEAYLPILEAINRLGRTSEGAQLVEVLRQHAPSWLIQLPALLPQSERETLQRQVHGTTRERMLRELAEALAVFTIDHRLVLVLEDLHWGDVSTLSLLSYLAQRREPARLLIIGTYRPADVLASNHPLQGVVQELQARHRCQQLSLAPLSEAAVIEYIRESLPGIASPAELAHALHQRTEGNPLFLTSTLAYLTRQGLIAEETDHWTLIGGFQAIEESVPESLRQLIETQINSLPEADQQLLEVASVDGVEFSAAAVAAGLDARVETVEAHCEDFARQGQFIHDQGLEEWPDGTFGGRYGFLHTLHHNVLYDRIAPARRIRLHRQAGERKEAAYGDQANEIAAELAMHFERGRDTAKAVQYLDQAGKTATRRYAYREARQHCQHGLSLLKTLADTPERTQQELTLQLSLGMSLLATKGYAAPEVAHTYSRARVLCRQLGDPPQLFSVLLGLCTFYQTRGDMQAAHELAEQLLSLANRAQDTTLLLQAHMILGNILYFLGEFAAARTHLERGAAYYVPEKHNPRIFPTLQDLGVFCVSRSASALWCLGYPDQAKLRSDQALGRCQELSHPLSHAFALHIALGIYEKCGEMLALEQGIEELLALSQKRRLSYYTAWGTILRGWLLARQERQQDGIAQLNRGLTALRDTGSDLALSYFLALQAETYGQLGQAAEGLSILAEAFAHMETMGEGFHAAELYRLKGELLLAQESTEHAASSMEQTGAEACFQQALEIAQRQEAKSLELRAALSLGQLWQSQGKTNEARTLLEDIYGWFTEGFDTPDLQAAEALLHSLGSSLERPLNSRTPEEVLPPATSPVPGSAPTQTHLRGHTQTERSSPSTSQPDLLEHVTTPSQTPASSAAPAPPPEVYTFQQTGDYWTLSFAGQTSQIKDLRGMPYIARLLQHPHEEFHVLTLVTGGLGPPQEASTAGSRQLAGEPDSVRLLSSLSDTGDILDPQARAAYKRRLEELQDELTEAQEFNDLGRVERLQEELDFLTQELASAVGLGGRARRTGSAAERARSNITKRIKTAIKQIADTHPTLGEHLRRTIRTGTFCAYIPDLHYPFRWQV